MMRGLGARQEDEAGAKWLLPLTMDLAVKDDRDHVYPVLDRLLTLGIRPMRWQLRQYVLSGSARRPPNRLSAYSEAALDKALAKEGLRRTTGSGWYVTVMVDGEPIKTWATDEPADEQVEGAARSSIPRGAGSARAKAVGSKTKARVEYYKGRNPIGKQLRSELSELLERVLEHSQTVEQQLVLAEKAGIGLLTDEWNKAAKAMLELERAFDAANRSLRISAAG